jgi:ferredoxin
MKVKLHKDYCIASGACVLECPEVFGQDDQGLVVLLDPDPPPGLRAMVRKAASVCPLTVIEIEDDPAADLGQ